MKTSQMAVVALAVDLIDTRVTDAGLAHLARLADLRVLDLMNTQVGDAGLAQLGRLSNLEHVSAGSNATRPGCERLDAALGRAVCNVPPRVP